MEKSVGLLLVNAPRNNILFQNLRNVSLNLSSCYTLVKIFFLVILMTRSRLSSRGIIFYEIFILIITINANKRFERDNIYVTR